MPRGRWYALIIFLGLAVLSWTSVQAQTATPTPLPTATIPPTVTPVETIYTVRPGDTLFRIAARFKTTYRQLAEANGITNPALIYTGQQIRIPGVPAVTPTATAIPSATTTYTVASGDTLYRIAVRNHTTVAELIRLNQLKNCSVIYAGQVLQLPTTSAVVPDTTALDQGGGATTAPVSGYGFDYGIQVYLVNQDIPTLTAQAAELGMHWVKLEVNWRDFEPVQGEINFAALDPIVDTLIANNLSILFTVTAAPTWARASTDEDGPPDDFAHYGQFIGALAAHYVGQVQAYEIWNEPNLRREWNSTIHSIGPASYIELLRIAYETVKKADPAAVVISGGLAPTGFNDGVNAINDRLFLRGLYAADVAAVSDAIGAHPQGWANPPDVVCCAAADGVLTHYQDTSFYFLNTLNDYRQIMVEGQDASTPIWVTEFGWGTSEDMDTPAETNVFVSYTSLAEQSTYVPRGFELGAELGFVGPMFLYNLNGCTAQLPAVESCYYSLVGPDGAVRPVFGAVQDQFNPIGVNPEPTVEITPEATADG